MAENKKSLLPGIFQQVFPDDFISYQHYSTHPTHHDTMRFCNYIISSIQGMDPDSTKIDRSPAQVLHILNSLLAEISTMKIHLAELLQPKQTVVMAIRMLAMFLFRLQKDRKSSNSIQLMIDQTFEDINELNHLDEKRNQIMNSYNNKVIQIDQYKRNINKCNSKILEARKKANEKEEELKTVFTSLKAIKDENTLVLIKIKEFESKSDFNDALYEEKTEMLQYLTTYELLRNKLNVINNKIEKIEAFKFDAKRTLSLGLSISTLKETTECLEKLILIHGQMHAFSKYMEEFENQNAIKKVNINREQCQKNELEQKIQKTDAYCTEISENIQSIIDYLNDRNVYKDKNFQTLVKVISGIKKTEVVIEKNESIASQLIAHYESVIAKARIEFFDQIQLLQEEDITGRL